MRTLTVCLIMAFGSVAAMGQTITEKEKIARENAFKKENTGYVSQEKVTFASMPEEDQNKVIMEVRLANFSEYDFNKMDPKVYQKFQNEVKAAFCNIKPVAKPVNEGTTDLNGKKDITRKGTADEQYREIMLKLIEKYKVEKKA